MAGCEVCLRTGPRVRRCARCRAVWYCSPECQKQNWPLHKSSCDTESRSTQASSGENFVPPSRELGATERQATSSGDPSASGDPSVSGDPSASSDPSISSNSSASGDPSASGGSSTELVCYKCGKREAEMKKCAKCKKAAYCSRDCQRQDWATHKTACAILSARANRQKTAAENEFGEIDSQLLEDIFRCMAITLHQFPVSPLTLRMWRQAKPRAVTRYPEDEVIEKFGGLESDKPFISPSPRRVVLLCLIKDVHHFPHGAIVEDINGCRRFALFCIEEGPEPYFLYEQLRGGNFLCLENALFHVFEEGIVGFQIGDPSLVHIIEMI